MVPEIHKIVNKSLEEIQKLRITEVWWRGNSILGLTLNDG